MGITLSIMAQWYIIQYKLIVDKRVYIIKLKKKLLVTLE